jgi:hypothetical protein
MLSLQKFLQFLLITSCLFAAGASYTLADEQKNSPTPSSSDMNPMMGIMNPHMMNSMMNPMAYMNMMNPMMGMMNPMMGMMNPMMGMMNPMMGMMNPMMGMNMMYPMMGMMGPMMGPMSGGMGVGGANSMGQIPGGQMMDPKQYEQWFNQWTEMMKNFTPQNQPQAK